MDPTLEQNYSRWTRSGLDACKSTCYLIKLFTSRLGSSRQRTTRIVPRTGTFVVFSSLLDNTTVKRSNKVARQGASDKELRLVGARR